MKQFLLDSTYTDSIIINSNDDISIIPSHNLSHSSIKHHSLNLNETSSFYISHHNKNDKFNTYNIIDYL